jgi:hypothetical protein
VRGDRYPVTDEQEYAANDDVEQAAGKEGFGLVLEREGPFAACSFLTVRHLYGPMQCGEPSLA